MFVAIAGCDKTGKSTLARELSKLLYFPVICRLEPKENIFIECIDTLTHYKEPMIIDRFNLDEEVYGPIKRGKSRFDLRQYRLIEMMLTSLNSFNIYTVDSEDKIKERFIKDNEIYTFKNEIVPILNKYEEAIDNSILNFHRYSIGDSIVSVAEKIKKQFSRRSLSEILKFREYRTVGNLDGEVLFVAEKYGDKLLPPLIPFGNNSPGLMLFEAFQKGKIDLKNIILTNAYKYGMSEKENEKAMIDELQLPFLKKVICLGTASYNYVKKIGYENVYKIKHPSYVVSYSNMTVDDYAKEIAEAYNS